MTGGALRPLIERLQGSLVGRRRELELVVAALAADRHIVIEGPPGTGKSTLLRAVADELGLGFEFVEGNAELTPSRLVGHFDPARVLEDGYDPETFVDGPLVSALRDGSLLYIEEINRVPEETLNVLVTVMSERELHVPRLGRIAASLGFRLVAAMNPFDAVGTARISGAIYDRVCRLSVDYQSADEEVDIVRRDVAASAAAASRGEMSRVEMSGAAATDAGVDDSSDVGLDPAWIGKVVDVVRATRAHPDLRVGSSVRGAIDVAAVVPRLAAIRGVSPSDPALGLDVALVALSGRVQLRDGASRSAEDIITELWNTAFAPAADRRDDAGGDDASHSDSGKATAPEGARRT